MRTRKLGWTDLDLTTVGLGTFAIGGPGWRGAWGPQDDRESLDTILRSLDEGINWIDTAPVYGLGHSEEIVGRAIKGLNRKPIIATKCGHQATSKGEFFYNLKPESLKGEVEASLKRLGIDVIDLYQVHFPKPDEEIEEGWEALSQIVREGKVRYLGASNFNVSQLKRLQAIHPVAALQVAYSMIERVIESELLPYCKQNNIGVVTWGPIGHGLLTGKFSRERFENLDEGEGFRRNICVHFKEPGFSANLELVEDLKPIAKKNGLTLTQLAIAWVLRRPEVTSAIVGARRSVQIRENASAGDLELSAETIVDIDGLLGKRVVALHQGSK